MIKLPPSIDAERLQRDVKFEPTGRWLNSRLSGLNLAAGEAGPKSTTLKDDTLRSGANTPGAVPTTEGKLRIARKLREAGVVEVEGGYPGIAAQVEFMKQLAREGLGLRVGSHARLWVDEFRAEADRSLEAGAEIVNWVGMSGYLMTQAIHPQLQGARALERIHDAVTYAKRQGAFVAIGTGCDELDTLHAWVTTARDAGADRLYVYDARGWYTPEVIRFLVRYVKDLAGHRCEVALHCHDDFGLATINTIEGVRAGAQLVDVTINRTGHRCGNAAFEQVAVALEVLYGISTGIDLGQIQSLSNLVAEVYGVPVAANAPIVGAHMFSYGGNHLIGMLQGDWFLWENVRAETVGAQRTLIYGPTALQRGPASPVALKVKQMGLTATPEQLDSLLARLEERIAKQRQLTDPEVEAVIRSLLGS